MILGIDLGSVQSKALLLDTDLRTVASSNIKNTGHTSDTFKMLIEDVIPSADNITLQIGLTGAGRLAFEHVKNVHVCNDLIALALGSYLDFPKIRSVIEVGGQSSRWLLLGGERQVPSDVEILDFALNERCAAGSGMFLEQQASRLRMNMEEFSRAAAEAERGAAIAGRCSVFAKSDMIHHQQKGTPVENIAYGLCLALARNFVATILRGRESPAPVLLTGGGFQNQGLVHAFQEVLVLGEDELFLSPEPQFTPARGAALAASINAAPSKFLDIDQILALLSPRESTSHSFSPPLGKLAAARNLEVSSQDHSPTSGYLGADVGSVSTDLVLLDEKGEVKSSIYLPTRGRPLEVLKEGMEELFRRFPAGLEIQGIGTTGSGRYLAGEFLEADEIRNEITCQLAGTLPYFPDVDTIFEIGGQDSKFISLQEGRIKNFAMNKICAAGTGSFLEEQAEQLSINIKDEFAALASQSINPLDLSCRCTVFMETELMQAVNRGAPLSDAAAGLAYAIVRNYLEKVVAEHPIGEHIVFQGGVASNPAVVKAFTQILNKPVQVHPYNRVSGAIGAARIARQTVESQGKISLDAAGLANRMRQEYCSGSFQCTQCSNRCEVIRIEFEEKQIFFGDVCERYTAQQKSHRRRRSVADYEMASPPDLFREWQRLWEGAVVNPKTASHKIGLPRTSVLMEYMPFWAAFFNRLGCEVLLSPPSNLDILARGLKKLPVETCMPIKLAFGHVNWLAANKPDYIFFPSLIHCEGEAGEMIQHCPYVEHIPWMVKAALGIEVLTPEIGGDMEEKGFIKEMEGIRRLLRKSRQELQEAQAYAESIYRSYRLQLKRLGADIIRENAGGEQDLWIIMGKPYNVYDGFVNLNLFRHLQKMGVLAIPQDFLPLEECDIGGDPDLPVWHYNRETIKAAIWSRRFNNAYPLIVSNFGCGPDAFSQKHIVRILADSPHLMLEFDEHRAEAGLITRLEAFYDEIGSHKESAQKIKEAQPVKVRDRSTSREEAQRRKYIFPYFSDHVKAFMGAMQAVGMETEGLPLPDEESLALGEQFSSGKECDAYSILAGDLVKFSRAQRTGGEVYIYPGSQYLCLLSQYGAGMKFILEDLGIQDLEVQAPSMGSLLGLMGISGAKALWSGLLAIDLLIKAACEKRPYERLKGETDRIHAENLDDIERGLAENALKNSLDRCIKRLKTIEVDPEQRPLIGIAGDAYTRSNPVANKQLFRRLEELGCEVWPAPFLVDHIGFSMHRALYRKISQGKFRDSAQLGLFNLYREMESRKVLKKLKKISIRFAEPGYREMLSLTASYIGQDNNEILLCNVAKMVDFAKRGADGVINAICLNCMLGTASTAIAKRIRKDFSHIPIPTMVFSGTDAASEQDLLEAFVYQVKNYAASKRGSAGKRRS